MYFLFVAEWAELNHRDSSSGSDVIESGSVSGEVDMDTRVSTIFKILDYQKAVQTT